MRWWRARFRLSDTEGQHVYESSTEDIFLKFHSDASKGKKYGFKTYGMVVRNKRRDYLQQEPDDNR